MLRHVICDAAIAAAKSYGHAHVEKRHILYAIARHFRTTPDGERAFQTCRAALEPRGLASNTPTVTKEADQLLASITSDATAMDLLKEIYSTDGPSVRSPVVAQVQSDVEVDPAAPTRSGEVAAGESIESILRELDALIGLTAVKAQVRSVIAVMQANQLRNTAGLAAVNSSLHLVFTGPPGTGKTTVARLVARLYAASGALPASNFVEASRPDLVAAYVGQTAIKTTDVITRARPGVLFVDEAYSLTPTHESDFGAEAISTLVKAMEDFRKDFAVIVAGYEHEMSHFIRSNPGLKSRFKTFIDFPNYTANELAQIFEHLALDHGIRLDEGAIDEATSVFRKVLGQTDFGNARFARSLFEQAYMRMAARAAADGVVTLEEVTTITAEDVRNAVSSSTYEQRKIGFSTVTARSTE